MSEAVPRLHRPRVQRGLDNDRGKVPSSARLGHGSGLPSHGVLPCLRAWLPAWLGGEGLAVWLGSEGRE